MDKVLFVNFEDNHRGIEGEYWTQLGNVHVLGDERSTPRSQSVKTGVNERYWNQDGKLGIKIQDRPRVQKMHIMMMIVLIKSETM